MDKYEFSKHREIFSSIKEKVESRSKDETVNKIVGEFLKSLEKLISEYPTSIWENRFAVGGALEIIFCAFLRCLGFNCKRLNNEKRYDVEINECKFSIKSNFSGSGEIRLINTMGGDSEAKWGEPTIVFMGGKGIYYIDPCMGLKTKKKNDAITVNAGEVKKNAEEVKSRAGEDYFIEIKIPKEEGEEGSAQKKECERDGSKGSFR